jgi:hypothetical protein
MIGKSKKRYILVCLPVLRHFQLYSQNLLIQQLKISWFNIYFNMLGFIPSTYALNFILVADKIDINRLKITLQGGK